MTPALQKLFSVRIIIIFTLVILLFSLYREGWVEILSRPILPPASFKNVQNLVPSETVTPDCNEIKTQRKVSVGVILTRQKNSSRSICNCHNIQKAKSFENETRAMLVQSSCSDETTLLGGQQKVISYSLYFKLPNATSTSKLSDSRYFKGVLANLKGMKQYYSGWVMRIYSNITLDKDMCDLVCFDEDIYFCDVTWLPGLGNIVKYHPMTWRFAVIGDPTVEKFAIRDLDSRLSQRERDAVHQWELSHFAIHGMRDHPWHGTTIMGGMWGADNYKLCLSTSATILHEILNSKWHLKGFNDQQIISNVIYSKYKGNILTHDSYLCLLYWDSVPFPTKRPNNYEYVGLPYLENFNTSLETHCPLQCRPDYGKDWEYC